MSKKIVVYGTKLKEGDAPFIQELLNVLDAHQSEVFFNIGYGEQLKNHEDFKDYKIKKINGFSEFKAKGFDYLITVGGDGTILQAIEMVRDTSVPIIGVNLGRLGFLSSIEKTKIKSSISDIFEDRYGYEDRTLLSIESNLPLFDDFPFALNDFTLMKRDTSSMVTLHTYIDGEFLNSYWADGIIVSTATGSTGYSLSCGGPIVFPSSGNIVITPIAPHNLNVRPVVISEKSVITFEIEGRGDSFLCTLDSRVQPITSKYKISISKSPFTIRLIRPKNQSFMKTIREKLMWGLDKRNH